MPVNLDLALLLMIAFSSIDAAIFERADFNAIRFSNLKNCDNQTLLTLSDADPLTCSVACGLHTRCIAFLLSQESSCSLLSTPCKAPSSEQNLQMILLRREHPNSLTWHFNTSRYILTQENGTYDQMQALCMLYGMYLWVPDTQEELTLVENHILSNLPSQYLVNTGVWGIELRVWIGVVDKPQGNCKMPDLITPCPVTHYLDNEPSNSKSDCMIYKKMNSSAVRFGWNDVHCTIVNYGLCERTIN